MHLDSHLCLKNLRTQTALVQRLRMHVNQMFLQIIGLTVRLVTLGCAAEFRCLYQEMRDDMSLILDLVPERAPTRLTHERRASVIQMGFQVCSK